VAIARWGVEELPGILCGGGGCLPKSKPIAAIPNSYLTYPIHTFSFFPIHTHAHTPTHTHTTITSHPQAEALRTDQPPPKFEKEKRAVTVEGGAGEGDAGRRGSCSIM